MESLMAKLDKVCELRGQRIYADKIAPGHIKLIAFPRKGMINCLSYDIKTEKDLNLAVSVLQDYDFSKTEIVDLVLKTNGG